MDKLKKRQVKKAVSWVCIVALVAFLAVMPLLAESEAAADGPQASILSGTVETSSIETVLHGGGTLASNDSVDVTIPTGVKLTEFLVRNGDVVTEGTPLAAVDRVSVMTAITGVQETMDYLVEQMNDADEEAPDSIAAPAGGRVKLLYAQEGESVQEVMLRDGALAVLSLDGLMAVQIQRSTSLTTGDSVCVRLSDGSEVTGRVESSLGGTLVVTVEDAGYAVGEKVTVLTEDGDRIGSGSLYIHNAWKATAYTGTVKAVKVSAESTVSEGTVLFTLSDTETTAQMDSLVKQHHEYEALMLELFKLYQSEYIYAPCDGLISGIDEDSVHLLRAQSGGYTLTLLANAPNGDDETAYSNFAGIVTGIGDGSWNVSLNPESFPVTDYLDLSGVPTDPASMTLPVSFVPTVPIYALVEGQWQQLSASAIAAGDILLFAGDSSGNFVWVVRVGSSAAAPEEPEPTEPDDPTTPSKPEDDTTPTQPEDQTHQGGSSGGFGGSMGGFGSAQEETEFALYDLEGSTLMTVTSQETMTLEISLDEQDISKISLGQAATVRVEALKNETFPAVVTAIGSQGTNSGGSSKFTVELTLEKTEDMLAGMSATASITLSVLENAAVVPLAALVEDGAETLIYTGYDEATGELTGPVTVTVGLSDGENVQILTGLVPGDSYYYAYYDTLELSTAVESAASLFG